MLQTKFIGKGEVSGFNFQQVYVDPKWYIYKVSSYDTYWYEVFKRKKFYNTDNETYPKAKCFGVSAWNVSTMEKALSYIPENCQKSGIFLMDEDLPGSGENTAILAETCIENREVA